LDDYYFKPFFRKHWLPGQPDEPDATIDEFYGRSKTYHSTHHVGPDDNSISETQVEFVAVAPIHPEMEPLFAFEKRRRSVRVVQEHVWTLLLHEINLQRLL
jgi:hypothetical protein